MASSPEPTDLLEDDYIDTPETRKVGHDASPLMPGAG
jgi:hypothetical protein